MESRIPRIAILSQDLFFGMRIRTTLQHIGYGLTICKSEEELVDAAAGASLVIVDFNKPVDWSKLVTVTESPVPVIAFGSHTYVDEFRQAKAAGVDRTVSNGELSRTLPDLIEKYRRQ